MTGHPGGAGDRARPLPRAASPWRLSAARARFRRDSFSPDVPQPGPIGAAGPATGPAQAASLFQAEAADCPRNVVPERGVAGELVLVADCGGGRRPEDRHHHDIVSRDLEDLLQRISAHLRIAVLVGGVEELVDSGVLVV